MPHTTNNRRAEPRALTAALVQVMSPHDRMTGVLEDVSPSGASVYVERIIPVGADVTLRVGNVTSAGAVKRCEPEDDGFRIGIEFHNGKWPQQIGSLIHWIDA